MVSTSRAPLACRRTHTNCKNVQPTEFKIEPTHVLRTWWFAMRGCDFTQVHTINIILSSSDICYQTGGPPGKTFRDSAPHKRPLWSIKVPRTHRASNVQEFHNLVFMVSPTENRHTHKHTDSQMFSYKTALSEKYLSTPSTSTKIAFLHFIASALFATFTWHFYVHPASGYSLKSTNDRIKNLILKVQIFLIWLGITIRWLNVKWGILHREYGSP